MGMEDATVTHLQSALEEREALVGVMGLGYVGLPLSMAFVRSGFRVLGFEVDPARAKALSEGTSYVGDVNEEEVREAVTSGRLSVTTDFTRLREPDTISICVPTPLRKTRDPDMSFVTAALEQIRPCLRAGQLIVLESTSYPGTTEELLVPMVEGEGLTVGKDVFVASSPERVDPANETWTIYNTPKVVGGVTTHCTSLAATLYGAVTSQVVSVSRPMAAELTKLVENTFRAVNIGLANEMALICQQFGVDTWEVVDAAATKPFGFMPFYPGPGIGGHCIPVDPLYLSWKLKAKKAQSRFIDLADDINRSMPDYVVTRMTSLLNESSCPVRGSNVLLLGVAYKRNVADVRESPALDVFARLIELGAKVRYHDPHVDSVAMGEERFVSSDLTEQLLQDADIVAILTDHDEFDAAWIVEHAGVILDTRNLTRGLQKPQLERLLPVHQD